MWREVNTCDLETLIGDDGQKGRTDNESVVWEMGRTARTRGSDRHMHRHLC